MEGPTVQEGVESALRRLEIRSYPAPSGRTDKGVHARMQVLSLGLGPKWDAPTLEERLRAELPEGIGLCGVRRAPRSFHAQWSCVGKEYRYRLQLEGMPAEAWRPFCWRIAESERVGEARVDPARLEELLSQCRGAHDFIAFHEKSSPRKPRTVETTGLFALGGGLFEVRIRGSGFGRHQVRYMVGSAVGAACGAIDPARFRAAIETGEEIDGIRAPAQGLILWEALYPAAIDPFSAEDRARASSLPNAPPFGQCRQGP